MTCLFCEIVQEIKKPSAEKRVYMVGENEKIIAILDKFPASDGHILLITKKHFANLSEIEETDWTALLPLIKMMIAKLKKTFQPAGFNVISNMGEMATQSIFHLHVHIIPKYEKSQGFIWTARPVLKYSLDQVAEKLKLNI